MLLIFWMLCRYKEAGTGLAKRERMLPLLERRFLYLMLTIEEVDFEFWTFWKTSGNKKTLNSLNNCFDLLWDPLLIDLTMNFFLGLLCWQVQDWCYKNTVGSKLSSTPISLVRFKSTWINVFVVELRMQLLDYQSIMKIINQYETTHR